jgi:hypothetical protein
MPAAGVPTNPPQTKDAKASSTSPEREYTEEDVWMAYEYYSKLLTLQKEALLLKASALIASRKHRPVAYAVEALSKVLEIPSLKKLERKVILRNMQGLDLCTDDRFKKTRSCNPMLKHLTERFLDPYGQKYQSLAPREKLMTKVLAAGATAAAVALAGTTAYNMKSGPSETTVGLNMHSL